MAEQAAEEDNLEEDIDQVFLDEEEGSVVEEGVDEELWAVLWNERTNKQS